MSKTANKQITLLQYILTIFGAQVGIGVLSLPRELAETAGTDGWVALLLGWVITLVISLVIIKIMQQHPNHTIYDILKQYFGKWIGGGLALVWAFYFALIAISVTFTAVFILQTWLYQNTSAKILTLLLLIPIFMITRQGVAIIAIYAEFIFFLTLWMPVLLMIPITEGNFLYLLPLFKEGWEPIILTVKSTVISFAGFELAFILYPFLKNKETAVKGIFAANTLAMITFLHITLVCYVTFSPDEITQYFWPTLSLLKPIQFIFVERIEVIFLTFYLFIVSTTVIPNLFASSLGFSNILGLKNYQSPLIGLLGVIFILRVILPNDYEQIAQLHNLWSILGPALTYCFPILLALYIVLHSTLFRR